MQYREWGDVFSMFAWQKKVNGVLSEDKPSKHKSMSTEKGIYRSAFADHLTLTCIALDAMKGAILLKRVSWSNYSGKILTVF